MPHEEHQVVGAPAIVDETCSERMPQQVRVQPCDAGCFFQAAKHILDCLRCERPATTAEEQCPARVMAFRLVMRELPTDVGREEYHAVLIPLATPDKNDVLVHVNVTALQADDFTAAQPGIKHEMDDQPVTQPNLIPKVKTAVDLPGFTIRQDFLPVLFLPYHPVSLHGVHRDMSILPQEYIQCPDGSHVGADRGLADAAGGYGAARVEAMGMAFPEVDIICPDVIQRDRGEGDLAGRAVPARLHVVHKDREPDAVILQRDRLAVCCPVGKEPLKRKGECHHHPAHPLPPCFLQYPLDAAPVLVYHRYIRLSAL